jgi:hypothetical protein
VATGGHVLAGSVGEPHIQAEDSGERRYQGSYLADEVRGLVGTASAGHVHAAVLVSEAHHQAEDRAGTATVVVTALLTTCCVLPPCLTANVCVSTRMCMHE